MNIINYSIENELLGSRQLNASQNRSKSISGLSRSSSNLKSIANCDNFTRKIPGILKEKEYDYQRRKLIKYSVRNG